MAVARDAGRMPTAINGSSLEIDVGDHSRDEFLDDDGRAERTGNNIPRPTIQNFYYLICRYAYVCISNIYSTTRATSV